MVDSKKTKLLNALNIFLTILVILLVIVLVLLLFVFSPMAVQGDSMVPSIHEGDKILIQKIGIVLKYNDIVVYERVTNIETGETKPIIKRVIGLPGDIIQFDGEKFFRNGEAIFEDYLDNIVYNERYMTNSIVKAELEGEGLLIEEGQVFCLGDNRNISYDCHSYGSVEQNQLVGKVILVY